MKINPLKLPIGESDFRLLIQDGYYFVDKSLLIKEVLEDSARVLLITRPRRFGKTLNLSMLRYYFAKEVEGKSNPELFDDLKIQEIKTARQHQGKYPVIFLTFKDLKYPSYQNAYQKFCTLIAEAYGEHPYLLEGTLLSEDEKVKYRALLSEKASLTDLGDSLRKLSQYLDRYHQVAPIILIDEYDTPIQSGYLNGYYPQIIELFRHFLSAGLKDNPHCFKAVLTGILRVSKESLFSGLNNLEVYSVLQPEYGQYFGFTESEVETLLKHAELQEKSSEVRRWYNGYQIGPHTIYNPWSILNCVKKGGLIKRYWLNTSDNALVKECLYRSGLIHKESFEQLLQGQTVECLINEHIVFPDLKNLSEDDSVILSFLLMAGYFKATSIEYTGLGETQCQLAIPNHEIKGLYAAMIRSWLTARQSQIRLNELLNQLLTGDLVSFETSFRTLLETTISVHDLSREPEAFYHGFMVGLTAHIQFHPEYELKSNRESGYGRYDYLILSRTPDKPSLLLEFKRLRLDSNLPAIDELLEKEARLALEQIEHKVYFAEIKQPDSLNLIKIGLAFCGKRFKLVYTTHQD